MLIANALIIVGMWVRHGGLDQLGTAAGLFIGIGQVAALLGTYLVLVQLGADVLDPLAGPGGGRRPTGCVAPLCDRRRQVWTIN